MRSKIGIIGTGNVGGEVARILAHEELGSVVLFDLPEREGRSRGLAMDIEHEAALRGVDVSIAATSSWADVAGADLLVVTAGLPRKPGQTRDDLVASNVPIVREVARRAKAACPDAFSVIVSNPLDVMTYEYRKTAGMPPGMVVGMAGVLDSARLAFHIARELGTSVKDVRAIVMGTHGDYMVPIVSSATCSGILVDRLLPKEAIDRIVELTRGSGTEIVSLLGTSAFLAAAASTVRIIESYLLDRKFVLPCSVLLDGEYGQRDICIGVPVVVGAAGVERVVEVELSMEEEMRFARSSAYIRGMLDFVEEHFVRCEE